MNFEVPQEIVTLITGSKVSIVIMDVVLNIELIYLFVLTTGNSNIDKVLTFLGINWIPPVVQIVWEIRDLISVH